MTGPDRYDVYLLVHPERFPSNGETWIEDADAHDAELVMLYGVGGDEFDRRYGQAVMRAAGHARRRIALIDEFGRDGLDEDIACGEEPMLCVDVPAAAFELRDLQPPFSDATVDTLLADLRGRTVTVGGYARHDCVARVCERLRALGAIVEVHETGTLPLTVVAAAVLLADPTPMPADNTQL